MRFHLRVVDTIRASVLMFGFLAILGLWISDSGWWTVSDQPQETSLSTTFLHLKVVIKFRQLKKEFKTMKEKERKERSFPFTLRLAIEPSFCATDNNSLCRGIKVGEFSGGG